LIQREIYEFGPYSLDSTQMLLRRAGKVVQLQPRALETLLVLVRRRGEVVSKQELMDSVWPDSFVEEGNLTQNIFLLRRELGKTPEGEEYIQTLPKRGYRMNMPVSHAKDSAGEQSNADSVRNCSNRLVSGFGRRCESSARDAFDAMVSKANLAGCSLAFVAHAGGACVRDSGHCFLAHCVGAGEGLRVCADYV